MNQVIANVLVSAAVYCLVSLGFSFIYVSARFFHFAHGVVITAGAYAALSLLHCGHVPLLPAAIIGVAVSAALGATMDLAVFRPMRKRHASASTLLLSSLGVYISVQALITAIFGAGTQTFRRGQLPAVMEISGARVTEPQVALIVGALLCVVIVWIVLHRTMAGKLIRAVACDAELARAAGIRQDLVILGTFIAGSALAGLAGILIALDVDLTPFMGFQILLMGVVAMVVGGVGSVGGAALGALLIASAQHCGAWYLSSQWQNCIVFATLILFFLVRPQGFLGKFTRGGGG